MSKSRLLWPALALAGILVFDFCFTDGFFRMEMKDGHLYGSLIDIFARATPVLLISLGMTFVIASGGVDLSVGAIAAIAGAVSALVVNQTGSAMTAILLALAVSLLAGLWNGFLVAVLEVQPIVATLVLMVAGRGIAQLLTGGQIIPISHPAFKMIGNGFFLALPVCVSIVLSAYFLAGIIARKTAAGLFIEAVGNNPVASRFAGVNTTAVKWSVYLLTGLTSGIAGILITAEISAADVNNLGLYSELDAILAVVIGGTALTGGRFSLAGAFIGGLMIQTVSTTIHTRGVAVEMTLVIKALVVLLVCLLQSRFVRERFGRAWRSA